MADTVTGSFKGKVWKFGDDINTDLVIPGFAVMWTLEEQLPHCFSANRPGWVDEVQPGVGGEIQLTDAIARLLPEHPVYGWVFSEGRFDIGQKIDYLRATVELALRREDLGPEFREFLAGVVRREGLA